MPLAKGPTPAQQLWKKSNERADKHTKDHKCVYSVNGDEYRGDYEANVRHGKGVMLWKSKQMLYNGDWERDNRHGYGMLSKGDGHGGYMKSYAGGWKEDKRHGYGTAFYGGQSYYEGEWFADKRHGHGRMVMADGTVYEGSWSNDKQSGQGDYSLVSGDWHRGDWKEGKMHGPGVYYYVSKGQKLTGTWVEGTASTGTMSDYARDRAPRPPKYLMPEIGLVDVEGVLKTAAETNMARAAAARLQKESEQQAL